MRLGLGPVFIYECLANSRRWQTYALRSLGVGALLLAMTAIATSGKSTSGNSARDYAQLGQGYFVAMIGVELALVMLAAPAATAGAICVDRARGTLAHMLMTDLSDAEIVLGKLAARLLPVFGLVACTWPVMAICSLLGGIDPIALTLAFAILIAVAVFGCAGALTLSVWARKSHEVILATYTVFILGMLLWPVWYFVSMGGLIGPPPSWTLLADPFYVAFAPYADPGKLDLWDYLAFFGVALAASTALTGLAVWRNRPVACRGSSDRSKGPRIGRIGRLTRWLPGPSLDRNPVLWREWHRSRPSLWMTAILALLMGTTGVLCVAGAASFWRNGVDMGPSVSLWHIAGVCCYVLHVTFGLLMLAAIAPTSMAEERQRGSLDILAATTLSTRAIVIGKWLGTFRLVWPMVIGPGLMALAMASARSGSAAFAPGPGLPPEYFRVATRGARIYGVIVVIATILAHGALITSVGVALAVWTKRQGRAIAMSVGSFILVTAGWPMIVSIMATPEPGRQIASLSPVVICSMFVTYFVNRSSGFFFRGILWYGTFWAVEVIVLAMGLLGLTVWTFDASFDRLPERPHRTSVRIVVIVVMAAMIACGSLVGAVDIWIEGVRPGSLVGATSSGVMAYSLVVAIGLVLVAVESAKSGRSPRNAMSKLAPVHPDRNFLLGRWWPSFGLVLLLAIGPALLALALATARRAPEFVPQFTTNAAGVQSVTSYVLARSDAPYPGEVGLGQRIIIAALFVITILVHGGAAIIVSLGLTFSDGWPRRALAAAVGLTLVLILVLQPTDSLLSILVRRTSPNVTETLWSVLSWDVVVVLFAIGLTSCIIRSERYRWMGASNAKASLATNILGVTSTVESDLVGD